MLRKICKWVTITLFLSLVIAVFTAPPARCEFDNKWVIKGTEIKYDVTGTECFVSWNFGIFINVTDVNLTHAFGDVSDTSDAHNILTNGDNISLSIFVIRNNVSDWKEPPKIHNTTDSQLLEHWNTTYVNFADTGVYEDVTRDTVTINFTIWTPAPPGGVAVTQNIEISWDNTTGVLVEYGIVQYSAEDPQFSGSWRITLSETNIEGWGVSTTNIPSFPIEILLLAFATGICGVILSKKMKRCSSA